jgi:PST family polysaccharide transporter
MIIGINNRLYTNVLWNVLNEAVGKGSLFIVNIYLARCLGPDNYGILVLSQSVTMYIWLAVDCGTSIYGVREVAKNKKRTQGLLNELFTMRITLGTTVFILYEIVMAFLIELPGVTRLVFLGSGLYLLVYSLYVDWILKGLEKFKLLTFGGITFAMSYLIGVLLFVNGKDDVTTAAFLWSLSFLAAAVSLIAILRCIGFLYRPYFHFEVWWGHIRESITFAIAGAISATYHYLPIFLIARFLSQQDLGIFSAPYRIIMSVTAPGFYIANAFFPVLSDSYYNDRAIFEKSVRKQQAVLLLFGMSLGIVGYVFSDSINMFLLGKAYVGSTSVLTILVFLLPAVFLRYGYTNALRASEYQKHQIVPFSVAIAVLLGQYLVLQRIGLLNLITLSVATVMAEIVMLITLVMISKMTYDKHSKALIAEIDE